MLVIIMRHGEAEDYSQSDRTRALTKLGVLQCENVGTQLQSYLSALKNQGGTSNTGVNKPEVIKKTGSVELALVSPYLRAQQSFAALAKHTNVQHCKTVDCIVPTENASQSADLIHAYACDEDGPQNLLVVSHMPLVSLLSSALCPQITSHFFDTAEAFVIDYDSESASGKLMTTIISQNAHV